MSRRKFKNIVATNIDQAYMLYMKIYDNKRPTASRFKKFINDDKRVQMREVGFIECDEYLRSTGRGRSSSGTSSYDMKRPKLNRPKSNTVTSKTTANSSRSKSNHRGTKSVDYKINNNKSRAEKPVTTNILKGTKHIKYGKNKYNSSSSSSLSSSSSSFKKKTPSIMNNRKHNTSKIGKKYSATASIVKKYNATNHRKKHHSNIGKKYANTHKPSYSSSSSSKNRKNRNNTTKNRKISSKKTATHSSIMAYTEPLKLPNDDELAALLNEIPQSPAKLFPSNNGIINGNNKKTVVDLDEINAVLKSFPFFEHMRIEEIERIKINDKIDHRYIDGQYLTATIIQKNGSKLQINYDKYGPYQSKYDIWSDYKYQHEQCRFAKYHSITIRPAHRMIDIEIGNFVDINPRRIKKKGHKGWKIGEVIKRDYKSGQIKIEYTYKKRKYQYWTHLDNKYEISPLASMVDIPSVSDLSDNSIKDDIKKDNDTKPIKPIQPNTNTATHEITLFNMDKFKELNLDTSIIYERSGYHGEDEKEDNKIELDYKNVNKWTCQQVTYWFNIIENGRFGKNDEYQQLIQALQKWSVKGNELLQINQVFLRMLGVGDDNDIELILNNIKKIASNTKKIKNGKGHNRKLSDVEIEKGIKKATKKYTKENEKLKSDIKKLQEANNKISNEHSVKLSELNDLQSVYSRMQKKKKKPSKELLQIKAENEEINNKLKELTLNLNEQKKQLNRKNDEVSSLQEMISSLNREIIKKDKNILSIKSKKDEEIGTLQNKLKSMADKYEKLNIEHSKEQKILKIDNDTTTKNSIFEQEREILNVAANDDDNKYDFDNNDEIISPQSIDNTTEETPESEESESVSVESVNSADNDNDNDNDEMRTIIIDNGSETIKIGYGSSNDSHKPSKKFHSIIGRPKKYNSTTYGNDNDLYIGDEAYNKSSILDIKSVINRGNIIDWDLMEKIWDYTFYNKLSIPRRKGLSNYNILLTESILRKNSAREKCVQIMFESFDINSLYLKDEGCLSLFGVGKLTGTVLGIGYGVTYSASIYEGEYIPSSVIKINSAGYDITKYLKQILSEKYPIELKKTSHSIIKDMKQKYCFITNNFHESLKLNANSYKKYKLPDGEFIRIGNERFRASEQLFGGFINLNNEAMSNNNKKLFNLKNAAFNNSGIHHMIFQTINSINDCDIKKELYSNIVLSGGSTLFKGLTNRLKIEMIKLTQQQQQQINIIANEKRKYLTWIGGSILSSISNCKQNFISNNEYQEYGPSIVQRKCGGGQ